MKSIGRSGNQFFQRSVAFVLAMLTNRTVVFNDRDTATFSDYLHEFSMDEPNTALTFDAKCYAGGMTIHSDFPAEFKAWYADEQRSAASTITVSGESECWTYTWDWLWLIIPQFRVIPRYYNRAKEQIDSIRSRYPNHVLVGVHGRYGDYMDIQRGSDHDEIRFNDVQFFRRAIELITEYVHSNSGGRQQVLFVVCSESVPHTIKALSASAAVPVIYYSALYPAPSDKEELAVLSQMDHVILTFGTFSYWAGIRAAIRLVPAPVAGGLGRNRRLANHYYHRLPTPMKHRMSSEDVELDKIWEKVAPIT